MNLRLSKTQEDADGLHQFWLSASSRGHSTTVEFYAYPDELAAFGRKLAAFTGKAGDEPTFECGSTAENAYSWLRLQAYPTNSLGHSALQVSSHCNGARHIRASASFSGAFEVAGLNQLGSELASWAVSSSEEFEYRGTER